MPHDAANAEMSQFWNAAAGEAWVAQQDALDRQLEPLGTRAAARAGIARGEQVLDIGCGCGTTTLAIARIVAPGGRVAAVDISEPMLAHAQRRARAAGLDASIEWMRADAQTAALGDTRFDCAFSRFGVMFFSDPTAAFRNVARALRPGGRVAFVCWQARERNPWFTAPARAAAQHVALPQPPAPDAPGPFAFADPARVRAILGAAGLADVGMEAYEEPMRLAGGDLEGALALTLLVGPIGAALREAKASEAQRERVVGAVRASLEQFLTPRGVEAPASAWIVSARRQ
jgi:SAM-dependent methyltransferase